MKTNADAILASDLGPLGPEVSPLWGPALLLASFASWGLVLGLAKLVTALVAAA